MSNQIRVSTSNMSRDVKKMDQQIAVLPEVIRELKVQMSLLASCWEGPAWMAFQNQVADDIAFMSEVYQFPHMIKRFSHRQRGISAQNRIITLKFGSYGSDMHFQRKVCGYMYERYKAGGIQ